jgi:carbonic anhydrase
VEAALHNRSFGLIDNWLRHVQDVRAKHARALGACGDETQKLRRLCELNVIEQVANVCQTTIVQSAWQREQVVAVHGWIYGLADGRLRDLGLTITRGEQLVPQYEQAVARLAGE